MLLFQGQGKSVNDAAENLKQLGYSVMMLRFIYKPMNRPLEKSLIKEPTLISK